MNKYWCALLCTINIIFSSLYGHYKVYGLGDSHLLFSLTPATRFFGYSKNNPYPATFRIAQSCCNEPVTLELYLQWIGPKTMHGINKMHLSSLIDYNLAQQVDALLFSCGEIDVRCHIEKQSIKYNRSIDQIIEKLINDFISNLSELRNALIPFSGPFLIFTILPPVENPTGDSSYYPRYGTLETRIEITQKINSVLRRKVEEYKKYNIHIVDVYNLFVQPNGTLLTDISDNLHHLNPAYNQPVVQALYEVVSQYKN